MHQLNVPQPSRQIYASSADGTEATPGKHGSFSVTLGSAIRPHNKNIEMRVAMVHASIPHSFYYVNETNNQFFLKHDSDSTPLLQTITPGNYSLSQLKAELENLVNVFLGSFDGALENVSSAVHGSTINKLKITSTLSHQFTLSFPTTRSAHRLLGFDQTYNVTASSHTSTNQVDLMNGMRYVFVHSNLAFGHVVASHAGGSNNLLAQIPLTQAHNFDILVEKPHHPLFITVQDYEIRHLEFGLTDQFGNHLDLHQAPWSIVLQVDFVRRPSMPRPPPDPRTLVSSKYYVGDVEREPIVADGDVGDDGLQGGV